MREEFRRAKTELEASNQAALAKAWRASRSQDLGPYWKVHGEGLRTLELLKFKYRVQKARALIEYDAAMFG